MEAQIEAFFDEITGTVTYLVYDDSSRRAAVIDPVLDFDPKSGRTRTESADKIVARVRERGLGLDWILETHAHADHLSAAQDLKRKLGGKIAIGEHIRQVQRTFKTLFNLEREFPADGSPFDHLFCDGERFAIGGLEAEAIGVPGHTPADMAYRIGSAVFVGDTLFMPDVGTARCDFPGGSARTLYRSIQKLLALPGETRLFMCHDYPPPGRAPAWESTVASQRRDNIHVGASQTEAAFVNVREARDAGLEMPVLILPSIQVNMRAGAMPPPESNGVSYLKIPINQL